MYPNRVFLNVPFDARYEPLFITLVASLVCLGMQPQCVLQISEKGKGRLFRIQQLLAKCRVSIHDLSRVGTPARFNMPFELGLAVSMAQHRRGHEYIVLDSVEFRLDKTLSDYKGRDAKIHGNRLGGIVSCMLDVFSQGGAATPPDAVRRVARNLRQTAEGLKKSHQVKDVYRASTYQLLVASATDLAVAEGLIGP